MKKLIWKLTICILSILFVLPNPTFAKSPSSIRLELDGHPLTSEVPPFLHENVTMVPLRLISEALGAQVNWNQKERTVTINSDTRIELKVGDSRARVGERTVELDVAAMLQGARVMVPLRFVGESLGMKVNWLPKERMVTIHSHALTPQPESQSPQPESQSELRAAWIASVYNLDWPSKSGLKPEQQQAEFKKMLDTLKDAGFNAVIVQVRPTADALYASAILPWSKYLTGVQGGDPGFDPLQFMIDESHQRVMAFHAWFNPFRASVDQNIETLAPNHPARIYPDRIISHQGKLLYNPGLPEVREQIISEIMEVVDNYNIDGVHLDDYFYPSNETTEAFNDQATYLKMNQGQFSNKADWRRDNINQFIKDLNQQIKNVKPNIDFGVSPFGVWRNQKNDPTGSPTRAGISTYDSLYADTRTWIRNGWIDYIAPQIYWNIGHKAASYDVLVDWWANETAGTSVKLYIGHAAYKLGTTEAGWSSAEEIRRQLDYNKQKNQVSGSFFFSAKNITNNTLGIRDLLKMYWNQ